MAAQYFSGANITLKFRLVLIVQMDVMVHYGHGFPGLVTLFNFDVNFSPIKVI